MALLHTLTIALHVLFAAAWFGMALALPALGRAALAGSAPGSEKLLTAMNGSAVLFYVFAFSNWVLGMQIGFELQYNAWPYHTSMTLGLTLVGVQLFLIRPSWKKLVSGGGEPAKKRLAMGVGIGHTVWLLLFVLMYLGRGVVGA
ncbi:MAG: hypothetical protein AAGI52_05865 [Bacteroidota bacterium]